MLSDVQFGPRLDCFDEKATSRDPFVLAPDLAKKVRKGQFTIFDDEEVSISPTHPLARKKSELSELWTRKAEDLDWDSIMKSASTKSQPKNQSKSQLSLDELTSLKLTKGWNVAMDSNRNTTPKSSEILEHALMTGPNPVATSYRVCTQSPLPPYSEAETSTTGLEDSRMTFPLHDLTGVITTKKHEEELMKYMGVNNLDFTIARRYAPKDSDNYSLGEMKNGFFHAYASGGTSKAGIEKMFLDPKEAKAKEVDASINALNSWRVQGLSQSAKAGDISQLIRQLIQLKANLLCITMDGHATMESADRMVRRANDWFHQMLDDLEKRIKDERRLDRQYRRRIKLFLKPIIDKLCDLELLYETLNFLEKRLKANNETTTILKENMRNARRILAKLTALDYKRLLPEQPYIETSDYTIAAKACTAFHLLEQSLMHAMPFITRSSAASSLIDTITNQMQGIHKSLVEEVPRHTLSEYNARLTSTDMQPRTNAMFEGIPPLEAAPRSLFGERRRRKYCSHIKLDPWSSEVSTRTTDPTALSSTEILSAKISTLPLSDFHESEMSNTPTEASLRKNDLFESYRAKFNKNLSEDRPPTVISSLYTQSDKSLCKSFEEAQLIRNFQASRGATPTSMSASGSTNRAPVSVTRPTLSTSLTPTMSEIPSYSVPGLSSTSLNTAEAEHTTTSITTSANSVDPTSHTTPVIASMTSLPGSGLDESSQIAMPVITGLMPSMDAQEHEMVTMPVISGFVAMPASDEKRIFVPLVASLTFAHVKAGTATGRTLPDLDTPEDFKIETKPVISTLISVNSDGEQPARVLPVVTSVTPLSTSKQVSMATTPAVSTSVSLPGNGKESTVIMPVVVSNTYLPVANPVQVTANNTSKPKISITSASTITRVPNVFKNAKYSKTPDPMRSHPKKGRSTKNVAKSPRSGGRERSRRAKKIVFKKQLLSQSPPLTSALKTAIVDGSVHRIRANLN
ncbi:unnamed protein product [Cylicocyclus nassatus]|uniref:Uncharacterized protein n=1 Tax=Cylicocyclus nassatus TaxID=53992 RepID=A0AA36HDB4_CYLNA|nr:unnamed protein product [Cylicocyclus nassatus]